MDRNELNQLTDEELLIQKKKMKQSKLFHAVAIGFLAGVLLFGMGSWIINPDKQIGFLIPMLIPVVFIYKVLKSPNKNADLEAVLKERDLR